MSEEKFEDGFAATYGFELLFSETPAIDSQTALQELEKSVGKIDLPSENENMFFMLDHQVTYKDGKTLPAQLMLLYADTSKDNDQLIEEIQQSWQTPNATEIVQQTNFKVLLTDIMSGGLPFKERHLILSNALRCFVKNSNCIGVACKRTQQIIDAKELISSPDPLIGFINVRFFNAGENGLIMDSLGLSALGLCDIQCHFTDLDPNEVSNHLYNIAYYIFNDEPTFENGHTIAGLNEENWTIQFEISLVSPEREVLDLHPGPRYTGVRE